MRLSPRDSRGTRAVLSTPVPSGAKYASCPFPSWRWAAPAMASTVAPVAVLVAVPEAVPGACRAPHRAPRAGCGMPPPRVSVLAVLAVPGAPGSAGFAPDARPGRQAPGARYADDSTLHAAITAPRAAVGLAVGLDGRPSGLPLASLPPSEAPASAGSAHGAPSGLDRHSTASCTERAAGRLVPGICDLGDAFTGFSVFEDVSACLVLVGHFTHRSVSVTGRPANSRR